MFPEDPANLADGTLARVVVIGIGIVLVALILVFLVLVFRLANRNRDLKVSADQKEREFEEQMRAELVGVTPPREAVSVPQPRREQPPPLPSHFDPPVAPTAPQPGPSPAAGSGVPVGPEEVARRLYALRILTEKEGKIPLPIPPDGLIYRMKKGGIAAILPRLESPEVMSHLTKRFDMVFAELPNGEVLVLERLQGRLPTLMDDFGKLG
ncbi:hypothetical protein GC173_01635 [bacterium]|nr:hypothetical protein [bacterium]